MSTANVSEQVYNSVQADIMETHPEDEILSHSTVKKAITLLTGIVPIMSDMCPNTCMAYTGPWKDLNKCPVCTTPQYDLIMLASSNGKTKTPQQQSFTIPLSPQLQAKYWNPEGACNMRHCARRTAEIQHDLYKTGGIIDMFDDIYHGHAYLEAIEWEDISTDNMVLMFSMDGAQLYQDKISDCWIYIWVIYDLPPKLQYKKKHVLPGGFIPGPNNPKYTISFLFTTYHHLAALQKEGLRIWDAAQDCTFMSRPFLHLAAADGPGSVHFTSLVGHHGAFPCRLYCDVKGQHKPGGPHYYPALLKPNNYDVPGCNHDDIDSRDIFKGSPEEYELNLNYLLHSCNATDYKWRRKDTGISNISIFSGLPSKHCLPVPSGFPGDSMHVLNLNLGKLLPPLWQGTFQCAETNDVRNWIWAVLTGNIWIMVLLLQKPNCSCQAAMTVLLVILLKRFHAGTKLRNGR
jgi:hypothetical protein